MPKTSGTLLDSVAVNGGDGKDGGNGSAPAGPLLIPHAAIKRQAAPSLKRFIMLPRFFFRCAARCE
jgi:hypothetical protein